MAILPSVAAYVRDEQTTYKRPVSENVLTTVGSSINYCLDQSSDVVSLVTFKNAHILKNLTGGITASSLIYTVPSGKFFTGVVQVDVSKFYNTLLGTIQFHCGIEVNYVTSPATKDVMFLNVYFDGVDTYGRFHHMSHNDAFTYTGSTPGYRTEQNPLASTITISEAFGFSLNLNSGDTVTIHDVQSYSLKGLEAPIP